MAGRIGAFSLLLAGLSLVGLPAAAQAQPANPKGDPPAEAPLPPPPPDPPATSPPESYQNPPPPARYPSAPGAHYPGTRDNQVLIPSRIATRLRVLESDLNLLANNNAAYIVDGIVSILFGGLAITLGVLADDAPVSTYLYMFGGMAIASGTIELALTPNASDPAIAFTHMPMENVEQVRERLEYGETQLERIAKRTRIVRLTNASINLGVGLAVIPVALAPGGFKIEDGFDVFVIVGAAIAVVSGVINLIIKSPAEKRWNSYKRLRTRLVEERRRQLEQGGLSSLEWRLAPLRGGAVGSFALRF